MTVRELLARIDSRELSEWMAYAALEPFGETRGDLRAGIVASVIANVHRGKGQKAFQPTDFLPEFGRPERQGQSVEDQVRIAELLTAAFGGTDKRRRH